MLFKMHREGRGRWLFLPLLLATLAGRSPGALGNEAATNSAAVSAAASSPPAAAVPSAARPSVTERCQKLLKRRDRGKPLSYHGGTRERCIPFKDGFFAQSIRESVSWGGKDFPNSAAIWDILWVRGGKVQVLDFQAPSDVLTSIERGPLSPSSQLADLRQTGGHSYQTDILRVQDLDGDGNAEIFIQKYTEAYEDLDSYDTDILTVRGRALVPYAHRPPGGIHGIDDVDKDGLPDFYTSGAYSSSTMPVCGGIDTESAVPAVFLQHTLPNGRYSETDATAKAALKKWCPQRPDLPTLAAAAVAQKASTPYNLIDNFAKGVVCARVWGATTEAVLAGIKPACPIAPNGCEDPEKPKSKECPAWVAELAAVTPTLLLN